MIRSEKVLEAIGVCKAFEIPSKRRTSLREIMGDRFRRVPSAQLIALDDVSFGVYKGEFLGIVGDNGSGKTTLLRVLAGIYRPDSGMVTTEGKVAPLLELGSGFNPELASRDNILINGCILGIPLPWLKANWREILSYAGLTKFSELKVKNFSSGMVSRLAFAIASFVKADIYLMDEVFAVGDMDFKHLCLERMEALKSSGKTIILVTHDLKTVQEHCSRAIHIEQGRVRFDGDASECVKNYEASHKGSGMAGISVNVENAR